MANRYMDGDAAANLLERRWFAAFKAASGVRAECEALLESMARAQVAWSRARAIWANRSGAIVRSGLPPTRCNSRPSRRHCSTESR